MEEKSSAHLLGNGLQVQSDWKEYATVLLHEMVWRNYKNAFKFLRFDWILETFAFRLEVIEKRNFVNFNIKTQDGWKKYL